ncbi:MAG TPA: class I tRNA ligase family protein, partial [Thermoproteota archaeon]|nr:class I tRNA ligase family protein [Thermoproteota archaeon]
AEKEYEDLDPFGPASVMRDFVWNTLADHYLELVKPRLYSEGDGLNERSARATLHEILGLVLITLHPVIPVITDYACRELYGQQILEQRFPSGAPPIPEEDRRVLSLLLKADSTIWRKKKDLGLSLNSSIDGPVHLNSKLAAFSDDLKAAHKIASIDLGEERSEDGEPVAAYFS